ncbi:hypothetical protein B0H16DRAFT_1805931 [Mycena metata]|uniref:Uncharacterized protein n=1 Tax=Mycena metata TaxID=1033252 RepID=A0AAD7NIX2_9AGAR|nr:hypothetical protein B0H16DRAFT_1805931 [Mycena metata]
MFSFVVAFIVLATSAHVLGLPSVTPGNLTTATVDVKIAAMGAAYALASGDGVHVEAFDRHDISIGKYLATDFFAAARPAGADTATLDGEHGLSVRRVSSTCFPVTPQQIIRTKNIYDALLAELQRATGTQKAFWLESTIDGTEQMAWACIAAGPFFMVSSSEPVCSSTTKEVRGTTMGTTSQLELRFDTGVATSCTLTTTVSTTLAASVTASVGIKAEGITAGVEVSFSASITNEQSSSTTKTLTTSSSDTLRFEAPANTRCYAKYEVLSCQSRGTIRVPFVLTGYLKFRDPTINGGPWVNTASLPEEAMSSMMEIEGVTDVRSNGQYDVQCDRL